MKPGDKVYFKKGESKDAWGIVEEVFYEGNFASVQWSGPDWSQPPWVATHALQVLTTTPPEEPESQSHHYRAAMPDGVEAKHIWEAQGWAEDAYKANILKYVTRMDHKGQKLSDARKLRDYAQALVDLLES